jgi:hypothetical protein
MIEQLGPLEVFWFLLFSVIGLSIGYRMGDQHTETTFGMEEGMAQITSHCAMVMALAVNAGFMHAYWDSIVAVLPQSGSDINELTASVIWIFTAIIWVIAPVGVFIARTLVHERWPSVKSAKH